MKEKSYKWIFYFVLILLIGGILFLSIKDITPVAKHIEQDIIVNMR